ncbi:guanylate kinase [Pseudodesulfovibrio senegalensis]|jgi:guanylate kinase|uniref:Guanylate kinase n=1 Tax=Pseudodesulfovibrio senegalensis TaxID=1721087 RepID=A0A6N6N8N6_9BACT|nr:guanylate kinase [Pseudodesulfovibrio senegalensis]KAB1443307.1 guanylate kinase [Pseudodesulfovibrio senegalensis]
MASDRTPRRGLILVICAPSGTGKSTLIARLMEEFPNFGFSISYTTREPRGQEQNGREYHFVSRDCFVAMRSRGEFAEWAEVHGNYYGTATAPVQEMLAQGRDVLFDIDVQGAMQLRKTFEDGEFVFLLPPSRSELERRLRDRGTDSDEAIERRLGNSIGELKQADRFDHWVVNDDLDEAYAELRAVYLAGRTNPALRPGMVETLVAGWGK